MPRLVRATLARTACLLALAEVSFADRSLAAVVRTRASTAETATSAKGSRSPEGDYQEAAAEAREVSRLSDLIHQTKLKISQWRRDLDKERRYHEHQKELIETQLRIRRSQQQSLQAQLEGYEEEQEAQLSALMCSSLYHAFAAGGAGDARDSAREKVVRTCMGLAQLQLHSARGGSLQSLLLRGVGAHGLGPRLWALALRTRHLAGATRRLEDRCRLCRSVLKGPADDLQNTVDDLEAVLEATRLEYSRERDRWNAERAELSRMEQEAGSKVYSMHEARAEAKERAMTKVKDHFCPVVMAHYSVNEDEIVEYLTKECPGGP